MERGRNADCVITIIHVNTERTWRGGEGQVFELVKRLPRDSFHSLIATPNKSPLMEKALDIGVPVIPLRSGGEVSFRQYRDLRQAALKHQASLFHVHTSHGLISSAMVRQRLTQPIRVIYSRRTDFHLRTGFLGISKRKYSWGADHIVSVSDAIKSVLVSDGVPDSSITTIYSGIDLDKFEPRTGGDVIRDELAISRDAIVIGMVAALAPHKDPIIFFKAAERLISRHPKCVCLLVGAGELWDVLNGMHQRSNLKDRFIMTGFRNDVPQVLAAMDIFCISSREEGLCTSILDAMAMELPVVATRAGGIPEAVNDGVTGYLVNTCDSEALAAKLSALVDSEEDRIRLGKAGRQRVESLFDIRCTVERTADMYRRLVWSTTDTLS